jgi:S1-C subfamily serine protease
MNKFVLSAGAAALALAAADHIERLQQRVDELSQAPRVAPVTVARLQHELSALRNELQSTRTAIEQDDSRAILEQRLARVARSLDANDCAIVEHDARLASWEQRWQGRDPVEIDRDLASVRAGLARGWLDIDRVSTQSAELAAQERERIESLDRRIEPLLAGRDTTRMWHELVGPVVQLAGDTTVGSGVLLESRPLADGTGFVTYVMTAWHVVRDIYGSLDKTAMPVPVKMYDPDGSTKTEFATMVVFDVTLDVALLALDSKAKVPHGAKLASPEHLRDIHVFDPVYAVGCPLGNDPIPTVGEIASTNHVVDGCTYWMLSAPTYIGNSGGGIYDARNDELIGIFSKIYTHGASHSTIVPHMGLATPMPIIYEWLERQGHASLFKPDQTVEAQTASAKF